VLILEAWTGNNWRLIGRIPPGRRGVLNRYHSSGHEDVLHTLTEPERTLIRTADDEALAPLVTLEAGEEWEVVLRFDTVPGAMLCRLRHAVRSDGGPDGTDRQTAQQAA
jgi:hypothetical protein